MNQDAHIPYLEKCITCKLKTLFRKNKMSLPYTVKKNNYFKNKKNSTIYTPCAVSEYLYKVLHSHIRPKVILDPSIGRGSLIKPWQDRKCKIIGVDIDKHSKKYCDRFIHSKFEDVKTWSFKTPDLVICNPPFNGAKGKKLYSEVFLRKIIELFDNKVPIALFVPMGFRLNQTLRSSRWNWLKETIEISSIISLPCDCFVKVKFHTEILIFNVPELKPHYLLCA